MTTAVVSEWYRKLALSLLTILIISATGQWIVWVKWSAQVDEQHIFYNAAIAELKARPVAARDAEPRIRVMEHRLDIILQQVMDMNSKLDQYVLKKINDNPKPKIWRD